MSTSNSISLKRPFLLKLVYLKKKPSKPPNWKKSQGVYSLLILFKKSNHFGFDQFKTSPEKI